MDASAIQAVKGAINIVDLVRRYVELRRVGHRWLALCPFHQDTKPSFSVEEEKGFFYCFGCQAAGDIFDFYSRINGVEFFEALVHLAREADIALVSGPGITAGRSIELQRVRERYLALYAWAEEYFRRNLARPIGTVCREYLQSRGLELAIVESFGLGYSAPEWEGLRNFLRAKHVSDEEAVVAGLLISSKQGRAYDRFRDRLMFPIRSLSNQGIAFGSRVLISKKNEGKYINTSDTGVYKKGEHLYGLPRARQTISQTRRVLLTEGYIDVLTLHQYGYTNACGVLGTALTSQQVKQLAGFCSAVDIIFDGDVSGRKAALRASEMCLVRGMQCRVVVLPNGEDVDSLLQRIGREALDDLLDRAVDGLEYCMQTLMASSAAREILDWTKGFVRQLANQQLLAFFLPRLSHGLGLAEAELRQAIAPAPTRGLVPRAGKFEYSHASRSSFLGRVSKTLPRLEQSSKLQGRVDIRSSSQFERWDNRHIRPQRIPTSRLKTLWPLQDLAVLRFVLRYPEQLPVLHERGALCLLTASRSKALWEKLQSCLAAGVDPTPFFDADEKLLWVESQLAKDALAATAEAEWLEICEAVDRATAAVRSRSYVADLRRAKSVGIAPSRGTCRDIELLRELQDIFRRRDG